ncbi:MAG: sulfite exporter TauE/SafE family protein [Acidobacteria bacterium]|nr:sulfite exporter TauE/SafE family protein [Acidobacteriota bacterium]
MGILSQTIFQSWGQYLAVGGIIFLGQFIYAAIGFGSGMVTISLLALLFGNINIFVPFFLLLCLPTELTVSMKDRKHINFRRTGKFLLFIFPGLIAGAFLLKSAPNRGLVAWLGAIVVILAVYYLFFEEKTSFTLKNPAWIPFFGSISGILGGIYGISGPPLIVYFKAMKMDKTGFRVALLSIFLAMSIFRTGVYAAIHLYTLPILTAAILTLPFALLGVLAGIRAHHRIPEHHFRQFTSALLLISGILLLWRNL